MPDKVKVKDRFKPGDLVEINVHFPVGECVEGREYKVREAVGDEHLYVEGSSKLYHSSYFKLATPSSAPSPIRTRREIVPGQWGNINVSCVVDGNVLINVRDDFGHVAFNAEQLREAAHILNQIAEVLEENAG